MKLTTTDIPPGKCPKCGTELTQATAAATIANSGEVLETAPAARPDAGSLCLCWHCGHLSIVAAGGELRELTRRERRDLPREVLEQLANFNRQRARVRGAN